MDAKAILNQVSKMQFQTQNIVGLEKRLRALEAGGPGGTTDHALLTHLAYASAGHTGFQPALGFTAVPNTRTVNGHALSADVTVAPSDLTQDSTHRFVTDTEKGTWNAGVENPRILNDGRLIRTSDTVLTWDGYAIGLWNGSAWVEVIPSSAPTLSNAANDLDSAALTYDANYDIYAQYVSATSLTLQAKKWTNDTTQAVVPALWQGRYVYDTNTNQGRLWLGTIRLRNATGAKFTNSKSQRFILNLYNKHRYSFGVDNPYNSDTHETVGTSWVSWNGNGADWKVEALCDGIQNIELFTTIGAGQTGGTAGSSSIGMDSKGPASEASSCDNFSANAGSLSSTYCGTPGLGYHYWYPLVIATGSGVTFYYYYAATGRLIKAGFQGSWWG